MPLDASLDIQEIAAKPTELFISLATRPYSFWLDGAGGLADTSRWSFLGAEPFGLFESREGRAVMNEGGVERIFDGDSLELLGDFMNRYALPPRSMIPPFVGGAVGWLSYDLANEWEPIPEIAKDDAGLPTIRMALYRTIYACDLQAHRVWRIERKDLRIPPISIRPSRRATLLIRRTFDHASYREAVLRIKGCIAAGDIYQANLTQRFAMPFRDDPARFYLRLRESNPASFGAYLGFGEVSVLSASPERFLRLDALTRRVETRPIKGTRPRSVDPDEDRRLAAELLGSEKDRAENLMIVDVHRNDLGKVCEYGSVEIPTLWGLESNASVHHLVSVVEGRLRTDRDSFDLLRAAFPAGSITGAPKKRAREIIETIEPVKRGIYTGAIGYLGWDGGMDFSVAIRTLIAQDGWAHYGVGGGIVADSEPDAEYQETLDKGRGLKDALDAWR